MINEPFQRWIARGNLHGVFVCVVASACAAVYLALGVGGLHTPWVVAVIGGAAFIVGRKIGPTVSQGWERAASALYGSRSTGTYSTTHSDITALEARGDYRAAASAWDAVAAREPQNTWPLLRAGELYSRQLNDPQAALERYRLAREVDGISPELHRYASEKIFELYLGPLNDERRGMAEMRRLITNHAGTREADSAREAIAAIDTRRAKDDA